MSLDTKYRPLRFEDVIGQDATVAVLRQFVKTDSGFHQSYLFSGGFGSGKTTLGRILARALLCDSPVEGNPCDNCPSCKSILKNGVSDNFVEVDAATNSGKDDMRKIVEMLQYDTFSGRRRIYLFDEAHRLSKDALDAILKPMEDTAPGTNDKLLVCIFCTTEPEKMRPTIFSRCAPSFVIRMVTPEVLADRLVHVCDREGFRYEREALVTIGEVVECHIRDALKSLEGISMIGDITMSNVASYLRLGANQHYIAIVKAVGSDLPTVLNELQQLQQLVSPTTMYERLSFLAMLAYRVGLGVGKPPSFWSGAALKQLWEEHQGFLLQIASTLAGRPGHPTVHMLECDLSTLHFQKQGALPVAVHTASLPIVALPTQPAQIVTEQEIKPAVTGTVTQVSKPPPSVGPTVTKGGVWLDPRGVKRKEGHASAQTAATTMDAEEFKKGLIRWMDELNAKHRSAG